MSLSSCCVIDPKQEASCCSKDADSAAGFLGRFQSKHAELAKLVAEDGPAPGAARLPTGSHGFPRDLRILLLAHPGGQGTIH